MKIQKVRDVKTPSRGTLQSAGLDFYTPKDFETVRLKPNDAAIIASGIIADIPQGYMLCAFNKSGISTKKGLIVGACICDEDYTGEIHLHVINAGHLFVDITADMKLVQFVLVPVLYEDVEVVESIDKQTERGAGGFGSTGS